MSKSKQTKTSSIFAVLALAGLCGICSNLSKPSTSEVNTTPTNVIQQSPKKEVKGLSDDEPILPSCIKDSEVSKFCTGCNTATVTYYNSDCSTYEKTIEDSGCTSRCPVPEPTPEPQPVYNPQPTPTPTSYCCKHCSKGKACGDSCINVNYTCTKPPGCACD